MKLDIASMQVWYPVLEKCGGLLMPKTEIVLFEGSIFEWEKEIPAKVLLDVGMALANTRVPAILRTDFMSAKHGDWDATILHTYDAYLVRKAIGALMEMEATAFMAPDSGAIVVREYLKPEAPLGYRKNNMPVIPEYRTFVENGAIACIHDYWPPGSIDWRADTRWKDVASAAGVLADTMLAGTGPAQARTAGEALSEIHPAWSIDFMYTGDEYGGECYLIDCAPAGQSYHWEGCKNEKRWPDSRLIG